MLAVTMEKNRNIWRLFRKIISWTFNGWTWKSKHPGWILGDLLGDSLVTLLPSEIQREKFYLFIFIFYFFCLLFLLYFTLQYCMVLPYIDMNPHGCTCVPKHEPPSHLPPHNISLGHHCAPAPGMLYPASDIDWRFDSYMIVYMLQFHSPKSSHPLPLPLSPKVRYTHLCLFCCFAYRVVIAIFLNSIHMC